MICGWGFSTKLTRVVTPSSRVPHQLGGPADFPVPVRFPYGLFGFGLKAASNLRESRQQRDICIFWHRQKTRDLLCISLDSTPERAQYWKWWWPPVLHTIGLTWSQVSYFKWDEIMPIHHCSSRPRSSKETIGALWQTFGPCCSRSNTVEWLPHNIFK